MFEMESYNLILSQYSLKALANVNTVGYLKIKCKNKPVHRQLWHQA